MLSIKQPLSSPVSQIKDQNLLQWCDIATWVEVDWWQIYPANVSLIFDGEVDEVVEELI